MPHRFTAIATRTPGGWTLSVDDVGTTTSRTLRSAPGMVQGLVARTLSLDPESVAVDVVPDLGAALAGQVRSAREAVKELEARQQAVAEQSRAVAAALKASGLSGYDVASVLGISPQRVSQLLAAAPAEPAERERPPIPPLPRHIWRRWDD